jgi:hypothetical protein
MSRLRALLLDVRATEVLFRLQHVVSGTSQCQVRGEICAALGERPDVMQLQVARLAAAPTLRVNVAAPTAITFEDPAPFGCGNVPAAPARGQRALTWLSRWFVRWAFGGPSRFLDRLRCARVLSRPICHSELAFLERSHEQLHGFEVHLAERETRSLTSEQRFGAFDEPDVLFARGKLHLVLLRTRDRRQLGGRYG